MFKTTISFHDRQCWTDRPVQSLQPEFVNMNAPCEKALWTLVPPATTKNHSGDMAWSSVPEGFAE